MRPGETFSLTVTLPNEQHIKIPQAVVHWSRGQEFAGICCSSTIRSCAAKALHQKDGAG